jgi:hypothetical protein
VSDDGLREVELLMQDLKANFVSGRVSEGILDAQKIEKDANGMARPYLEVMIQEPYGSQTDRTLDGEKAQPMIQPFTIRVWAVDPETCRLLAAAVRSHIRGLQYTDNMTEILVRGGGSFEPKDSDSVPSLWARLITAETTINMSTAQAGV